MPMLLAARGHIDVQLFVPCCLESNFPSTPNNTLQRCMFECSRIVFSMRYGDNTFNYLLCGSKHIFQLVDRFFMLLLFGAFELHQIKLVARSQKVGIYHFSRSISLSFPSHTWWQIKCTLKSRNIEPFFIVALTRSFFPALRY